MEPGECRQAGVVASARSWGIGNQVAGRVLWGLGRSVHVGRATLSDRPGYKLDERLCALATLLGREPLDTLTAVQQEQEAEIHHTGFGARNPFCNNSLMTKLNTAHCKGETDLRHRAAGSAGRPEEERCS